MSNNIYTIYKATNIINGKCYIGFDSKWPNRIKRHKGDYKKSNTIFHRAIRKYGWESFDWEIIYQSKDKNYTLNECETFFIKEYNTFYTNNLGYNMTTGGEGCVGNIISKETREKLSKIRMGKEPSNKGKKGHLTEQQKINISNAQKERFKKEIVWNKGKKGLIKPNSGSFKKVIFFTQKRKN